MFKPLLRLTLVHLLWSKYRKQLIFTVLAIASILVISFIHNDYIEYAEHTQQLNFVGYSYLVKWLLYLFIIAGWIWLTTLKSNEEVNSEQVKKGNNKQQSETKEDPFQTIREKDTLSSKGDQIINKK